MVARSLIPYQDQFPDVVVFATGTANSQLPSVDDYRNEYDLLCKTLQRCKQESKRLVYLSSAGAVYGQLETVRDELTPTFPVSAYGKHKLLCEAVIQNSMGMHLIIRLANLVGSSQNPSQLIPALYNQILSDSVVLYRQATRDIMDVSDFATILLGLLSSHKENGLLLLTTGFSTSIVEIFNTLQQLLGKQVKPTIIEGGNQQIFSTEKLMQVIPNLPFSPNYYVTVLEHYVNKYICAP